MAYRHNVNLSKTHIKLPFYRIINIKYVSLKNILGY